MTWRPLLMAGLWCGGLAAPRLPLDEEASPTEAHLRALSRRLERETTAFPHAAQRQFAQSVQRRQWEQATSLLAVYTLVEVEINPEARLSLRPGSANRQIPPNREVLFLLRLRNRAGLTSELRGSLVAAPPRPKPSLFVRLEGVEGEVGRPRLSGAPVEYLLARVRCSALGAQEITLVLDAGQGTQDLGFRSELPILFQCVSKKAEDAPRRGRKQGRARGVR